MKRRKTMDTKLLDTAIEDIENFGFDEIYTINIEFSCNNAATIKVDGSKSNGRVKYSKNIPIEFASSQAEATLLKIPLSQ
jgi:hypothetical protein